MRQLILAAMLAAGTATVAMTPAPANAQSFSASRLIYNFDYATLQAVVNEMDGTVEDKGDGSYRITFENGTVTTATFTVCGSGKCFGTHLEATFGKPSDKSVSQTEALVTEFNKEMRTISAYNLGEGRSTVSMYIISDGGVTMENYRMHLAVFEDSLRLMREKIYTDG